MLKKILLFCLIAMILFLAGCTHLTEPSPLKGTEGKGTEGKGTEGFVQILSPTIVANNSSSNGYTIQDNKGNSIGTIPGGYSYIGMIGDNAVFVDKIKALYETVDVKTGSIRSDTSSLLVGSSVIEGTPLDDAVVAEGLLWQIVQVTNEGVPAKDVSSLDPDTWGPNPFEALALAGKPPSYPPFFGEIFLAPRPPKEGEVVSAFICAIDKTNIAVLINISQPYFAVHSLDHNTPPKEINVDKSVALPFLSEPVDKFTMIPLLSADRKTLYRIGFTKDGELTRFTGTIHLQGTEQFLQAKDNYIIAFTETALTAYSGGNDKSFETNIRDIPTIYKNYVFYVRGNSVFANQLGTKEEINICSIGNVKVVAMRVIDQKLFVAFDQNGKISLQEFVIPTTIVFNP